MTIVVRGGIYMFAPVLISVYDRVHFLESCLNSIKANEEARMTELYIAVDHPSKKDDVKKVRGVLNFCKSISGFKTVNVIERSKNVGPHRNLPDARKDLLKSYPRLITLEDDNVVSINFLKFMNDALSYYEDSGDIFCVCGYNYPVEMPVDYKSDVYLWTGCTGWSVGWWATKMDYSYFSYNRLGDFLRRPELVSAFMNVAEHILPTVFSGLTKGVVYADAAISYNMFLNEKYQLYPVVSKVRNLGYDGRGVNCNIDARYTNQVIDDGNAKFDFSLEINPDPSVYKTLFDYFKIGNVEKENLYQFIRYYIGGNNSSESKPGNVENEEVARSCIEKTHWSERQASDELEFWKNPELFESLEGYPDYRSRLIDITKNMFVKLPTNFQNMTVCEIGGGAYAGLLSLIHADNKIMIDPLVPEYLNLEHDFSGVTCIAGCAEDIPLGSASVDACICTNALDHMYRPYDALKEILRILKPGGYFALAVDTGGTPGHPIAIEKEDLDKYLSEEYFEILEQKCSSDIRSTWPASLQIPVYVFQGKKKKTKHFLEEPVSRVFGYDRGLPIDRHYIESFLFRHQNLIRGRVLEIGDDGYTRRFGTLVTASDVLSAVPGSGVTIVGDLATGENIPEGAFDCILMTQTLQMIYDVKSALRTTVGALKPGGTLLVSASGISQISRYDMDRWGEYWRFTDLSLKRLLSEAAPGCEVRVTAHGNVSVAKAFLDGRAHHELPVDVLDHHDPDYPVILTAVLVKPTASQNAAAPSVRRATTAPGPSVLIYHRVADDPVDAQMLAVSPDHFSAQLKHLVDRCQVVPLGDLLSRIDAGLPTDSMVAVTFDDGYADNLHQALPIIESHQVPVTIFVASGGVDCLEEFWWDAMEHLFFEGPLPARLDIGTPGTAHLVPTRTPADRETAYHTLCGRFRNMPPAEIDGHLARIYQRCNRRPAPCAMHRRLTSEQLVQLARSPFVEIGAHTVNHPRLSVLTPEAQMTEIYLSKRQLEAMIGKPVTLFSYPFGTAGDFSAMTVDIVRHSGFTGGIANIQGRILPPLNRYRVPRRLVRNWPLDDFATWLTGDDADSFERAAAAARDHRLGAAMAAVSATPQKAAGDHV